MLEPAAAAEDPEAGARSGRLLLQLVLGQAQKEADQAEALVGADIQVEGGAADTCDKVWLKTDAKVRQVGPELKDAGEDVTVASASSPIAEAQDERELTWHWTWEGAFSGTCKSTCNGIDITDELELEAVATPAQLLGDETQSGPDGELYDIFYPAPGIEDEKQRRDEEVSSTRSGSSRRTGSSRSPSEDGNTSGGSAADELMEVMGMMRRITVARHPARAQLFEAARSAVSEALGGHLDRLTIVGSTALRIDTPASDLDVVAFTRPLACHSSEEAEGGGVAKAAPEPVEALRLIARTLEAREPSFRVELIVCTRVPVLVVWSASGELSLDLTVDQPLAEWHVLWFQSQQYSAVPGPPMPLQRVPTPTVDERDQGLLEAMLRCTKWWLRRRQVPVTKEGGYPSLVWTLMALHALRCSVLLGEKLPSACGDRRQDSSLGRAVLGALAAFFDRFSERSSSSGTLCFAEGTRAEFWPQEPQPVPGAGGELPFLSKLSVLDPTATLYRQTQDAMAPTADLAPRISPGTQLLHAYELRRAQFLSATALASMGHRRPPVVAVQELFAEAGAEGRNRLPAICPEEATGVILLCGCVLSLGILRSVSPKHGWNASFLHRRDSHSIITVRLCEVDSETGAVTPLGMVGDSAAEGHFTPCHFVCLAPLLATSETYGDAVVTTFRLDEESQRRWLAMQGILADADADSIASFGVQGRPMRTQEADSSLGAWGQNYDCSSSQRTRRGPRKKAGTAAVRERCGGFRSPSAA